MRTAFDLSPLYRSTVGFDRLCRRHHASSRADQLAALQHEKLGDDHYCITMALAGFTPDEIELVQQENTLLVAGRSMPSPRASRSCIVVSRPAPSGRPSTWLTM